MRRLAFGAERDLVRPTGINVATMSLDEPVDHPEDVLVHDTPGRLVAIHPSRDKALVAFIFRGEVGDLDHRDTDLHKRIVTEAYAGVGWRVPELLERLRASEDLYFDAVSVVDLPAWSQGGIALLGDAASCVSLLGDGSSLAIAGAHTLAGALAEHRAGRAATFGTGAAGAFGTGAAGAFGTGSAATLGAGTGAASGPTTAIDPAFARYESVHRARVAPKQRAVRRSAALLVPKTRLGLAARNLGARLWPGGR